MVLLYLIVLAPNIGSKILPLLMTMPSHWPPLVGPKVSGESNDHVASNLNSILVSAEVMD